MAYKKKTSKKPSKAQQIAAELHQQLLDNVQQLVTSDAWPKLLKTVTEKNGTELSRFSFNNLMLILAQNPNATAVATYDMWQERGRQVKKGEKSLRIYAPIVVTERKERDGEEVERTRRVGFRMIPEFDVSQTEPIWQDGCTPMFITPAVSRPQLAKELEGDAPAQLLADLTAQVEAQGYTVEYAPLGSTMGLTDPKNMVVRINSRVSLAQAAKTLAHELGHILADHVNDVYEYRRHRGMAETVAESFAYMVCSFYGLDSIQYSAPYIASWTGREDAEETMQTVVKVGNHVLMMFREFLAAVDAPLVEQGSVVTA